MAFFDIIILEYNSEGTLQKYAVRFYCNSRIEGGRIAQELELSNGETIFITRPCSIELTEQIKDRILNEYIIRKNFGTINSTINIPIPKSIKSIIIAKVSKVAGGHPIGSFLRYNLLRISGMKKNGKPAEIIEDFLQNLKISLQSIVDVVLQSFRKHFKLP